MRLTRKFIAALVIGVALVALVQGYLNYERERGVFDRHLHGEATALGRALAGGITYVWQRDGEAAARAFLATATAEPAHGLPASLLRDLPPLGALLLAAD